MYGIYFVLGLNTAKKLISFNETWDDNLYASCVGQRSTDATPFKDIFDNEGKVYTNKALYDLLDPMRDNLPFIYDNFRFPHCEVLDFDMVGY